MTLQRRLYRQSLLSGFDIRLFIIGKPQILELILGHEVAVMIPSALFSRHCVVSQLYSLVHSTLKVRFRYDPALRIIASPDLFQACQVVYHDIFAFSCTELVYRSGWIRSLFVRHTIMV